MYCLSGMGVDETMGTKMYTLGMLIAPAAGCGGVKAAYKWQTYPINISHLSEYTPEW